MKLRVAIVDDEADAREAIRALLSRRHDVEIVAEYRNGHEVVEALPAISVDLLLLDVQMPGLDGFGVVRTLGLERMPATIFVAPFEDHAVQAFEVEALDYLVKPFVESRFLAALDRARRHIDERRTLLGKGDGELTLMAGTRLRVSRRYRHKLRALLPR